MLPHDKLRQIEERFEEVNALLGMSDVIANQKVFRDLSKEHAQISEVVAKYKDYRRIEKEIGESSALLDDGDKELQKAAEEDLKVLREQLAVCEQDLQFLLIPKDPLDEKNTLLEIRAGTGGDEASLFVADLFRMYTRYAESQRWRCEVMSSSPNGLGGLKEVIMLIEGAGVYSALKYEGGVHRVQRVPETEAQGRIHTSTVTVAVLPEAEDVEVEINETDLQIDVYRSSGAGGQSVNTTDSAVRITHKPTGLVVTCQDERSQHKNKGKALKVLRSRLLDLEIQKQQSQIAGDRRSMVGTGDRSERIRTYNFPQARLTDHRIGLTIYKLEAVLEGDLKEVIVPLRMYYQTEMLRQVSNS